MTIIKINAHFDNMDDERNYVEIITKVITAYTDTFGVSIEGEREANYAAYLETPFAHHFNSAFIDKEDNEREKATNNFLDILNVLKKLEEKHNETGARLNALEMYMKTLNNKKKKDGK